MFHGIFFIKGGTRFWGFWWGNTKGTRTIFKGGEPTEDKPMSFFISDLFPEVVGTPFLK